VLARHVVGRGQQLARRLPPQHELRLLAGGLGALQKVSRVALAGAKLCEDPHVLERVPVRREPVLHGARVQRQPHGLGLILHLSGECATSQLDVRLNAQGEKNGRHWELSRVSGSARRPPLGI